MKTGGYVGNELGLFKNATNWKKYWSKLIIKYIGGIVLEVGSGLCANTEFLCNKKVIKWICLEPDINLAKKANRELKLKYLKSRPVLVSGTTRAIKTGIFDSIVYIDVLEHIPDHENELLVASKLLKQKGKLVVLAPAYMFLYSNFDKAIGHFRRYTKRSLRKIAPETLAMVDAFYIDSLGVIVSYVNKHFLKKPLPKERDIAFWDKIIVPLSRLFDAISFHRIGKTVCIIWEKIENVN